MRVMAAGLACLAVASGSAAASTPSRLWQGVERIALACTIDAPMSEEAKAALCARLAAAAQGMTRYPVTQTPPAAPGGEDALVLHLFGRADAAQPHSIAIASQAERTGLMRHAGRQSRFMSVALIWRSGLPELAGPMLPLAIHLAPPARARRLPDAFAAR